MEIIAGIVVGIMIAIFPRVARAWDKTDSAEWAVGGVMFYIFGGIYLFAAAGPMLSSICSN